LLAQSQRDRLEVVLVSPRNPLNIGAAARAMANFGYSHLAVVAPYEEHWREAKSAVGASDLLQNARRVERLAAAVADCTLVVGTGTLQHRKPEQPVIPLPELTPFVDAELTRDGRVALVFGPEKRGLTREDLALCHVLVEIPTDPRQPSMNLGQAVAVCLYELARASRPLPPQPNTESGAPPSASAERRTAKVGDHAVGASSASAREAASAQDLDLLAAVVAETMQAADYSPAAMQKANRHDLELLLRRLKFERRDARRILGLFRRILWRLKRQIGLKD
jgi:tRNA/rRNA methyltransferase